MRGKRNIGQHELIELNMEVVSATDKSTIGLKGTITDETRNTFLVNVGSKELRLQKKGTVLRLNLNDEDVEVDCDHIIFRPEDRIKRVKK